MSVYQKVSVQLSVSLELHSNSICHFIHDIHSLFLNHKSLVKSGVRAAAPDNFLFTHNASFILMCMQFPAIYFNTKNENIMYINSEYISSSTYTLHSVQIYRMINDAVISNKINSNIWKQTHNKYICMNKIIWCYFFLTFQSYMDELFVSFVMFIHTKKKYTMNYSYRISYHNCADWIEDLQIICMNNTI